MEYVFYCVISICGAVLLFKLIDEIRSVKWPDRDPNELIESNAEIEALKHEINFLRAGFNGSNEQLRNLQKLFAETVSKDGYKP